MKGAWLILIVLVSTASAATDMSERDQMRAYYQLRALQDLAEWEAGRLHPKDEAARAVEEARVRKDAYERVARAANAPVETIRVIETLGEQRGWPAPGDTIGGESVSLKAGDSRPWSLRLFAKDGAQAGMAIVGDRATGNRTAGRCVNNHAATIFQPEFIRLPGPGRYRASYRLMLTKETKYSNYVSRVVLNICCKDRAKPIATRMILPTALPEGQYVREAIEFEVDATTLEIRPEMFKVGMTMFFDNVELVRDEG